MKIQTHLLLYLREIIDNWKYIDGIIFLIILLMYVGFTDPCDRCIVDMGYGGTTCKDAFMQKIGYEENDLGIVVKKEFKFEDIELNITR
jgi:hypothetical protein